MPSVWNFVGDEARTALTAYVFQVSTESGGTTAGLCVVAEAIGSDAAETATRKLARTSSVFSGNFLRFISPPFPTRSPRRRETDRGRRAARRAQRRGPRERRRRRSRSRPRERGSNVRSGRAS